MKRLFIVLLLAVTTFVLQSHRQPITNQGVKQPTSEQLKSGLKTERKCYFTAQARDAAYQASLAAKQYMLIMDNDSYDVLWCGGDCIDYCYVIKFYE